MAAAGMLSHSASYPRAARSPSTSPIARPRLALSRPGTFSSSAYRGRNSRRHRANSGQSQRSSWTPLRRPATETGGHGNPPQMRSGHSTSLQSIFVMSPRLGMPGQCLARTRLQYGSISDCHMTFIPARSSPRSSPPIPEKREPTVRSVTARVAPAARPTPVVCMLWAHLSLTYRADFEDAERVVLRHPLSDLLALLVHLTEVTRPRGHVPPPRIVPDTSSGCSRRPLGRRTCVACASLSVPCRPCAAVQARPCRRRRRTP